MPTVATLQRAGVRFAMEGLTLESVNDSVDQASLRMHWRGGECPADFERLHIDEQRMAGWAATWARQGFPSVQMHHKYAAALVATVVPEITPIRPPWPCFLVRVPDGLISLVGMTDRQPHDVRLLLCVHMAERWSFTAIADDNTLLNQFCRTTQVLAHGVINDGKRIDPEDIFSSNLDDQDKRASSCIGRLLLNMALAMSDPTKLRAIGKSHNTPPPPIDALGRFYHQPDLRERIFEVGEPVRVDCRESVRGYVLGQTQHLKALRFLVRGHWRNQAHGPAQSLRAMRWIEPYWKGDSDAPVLVRPHDLQRT